MIDLFLAFRWRDAVDILLVAIVLYRVLVMFRGTRALQMLIGLGFLVLASLVAQRLQLHSTQWILDNFWSFWVIALVVLFQPELRRALARIGQGRALPALLGAARDDTALALDELARVVPSLAARRIGALIVIERGTGLRQYAELGVPLDAVVSADLIESVFVPHSPLHDGAVFVQGPRLVAAGCFLPLSRNLQVARAYGTRHRAALGITEETDAVALVVSEETGRMSIAVEGQIETVGDGETLRRRLDELVGGRAASQASAFRAGVRRLLARTTQQG